MSAATWVPTEGQAPLLLHPQGGQRPHHVPPRRGFRARRLGDVGQDTAHRATYLNQVSSRRPRGTAGRESRSRRSCPGPHVRGAARGGWLSTPRRRGRRHRQVLRPGGPPCPTRRGPDGAGPDLPVLLLAHQLEFTDRAAIVPARQPAWKRACRPCCPRWSRGHRPPPLRPRPRRPDLAIVLCHRVRLDQPALADLSTTDPAPSSAPRPTCPLGAVHRSKDRAMRRSPG